MGQHESEYDPKILEIFKEKVFKIGIKSSERPSNVTSKEKEIMIEALSNGMVIARDIIDKNGMLIVAKGTVVNDPMRYKLVNYFRLQSDINLLFIDESNPN
jgi:hypothetical protein